MEQWWVILLPMENKPISMIGIPWPLVGGVVLILSDMTMPQ
jgi:hypothetical protein